MTRAVASTITASMTSQKSHSIGDWQATSVSKDSVVVNHNVVSNSNVKFSQHCLAEAALSGGDSSKKSEVESWTTVHIQAAENHRSVLIVPGADQRSKEQHQNHRSKKSVGPFHKPLKRSGSPTANFIYKTIGLRIFAPRVRHGAVLEVP